MTQPFNAKSTADQVLTNIDLSGKRFLVTGVSSGIGLETSRSLVARGATVIGTVRTITESLLSQTNPIQQSAQGNGGHIEFLELDLSSLKNVYHTADSILQAQKPIDGIIANAGVMATPFVKTVDGFESQFGINYVGHFALINRIIPMLTNNARVVVLSSQAHRVADIDLTDPHFDHQAYEPFLAYGRSKTATTLFAKELDIRYRNKGIRAVSVMPGNSLTNLPRNFSDEELQGLFETVANARAEAGLPPGELKDIAQAAATSVWALVLADMDKVGGLYLEDCAVSPINDQPNPFADGVMSYALDTDSAEQLWSWTTAVLQQK